MFEIFLLGLVLGFALGVLLCLPSHHTITSLHLRLQALEQERDNAIALAYCQKI